MLFRWSRQLVGSKRGELLLLSCIQGSRYRQSRFMRWYTTRRRHWLGHLLCGLDDDLIVLCQFQSDRLSLLLGFDVVV